MKTATLDTPQNVITLTVEPKPARPAGKPGLRFNIVPFTNRGGSEAWRVSGIKRDGTRVRENYADEEAAKNRRIDLEAEYRARASGDSALRATRLTDVQIRLAEVAFPLLGKDEDLLPAVQHWLKRDRQNEIVETKRIDEAVTEFKAWLDKQPDNELSHRTKMNLRVRVDLFANSIGNLELASITTDTVKSFLDKREVSRQTKTNDRLALSRFFAWCREKKWLAANPARKDTKTKRPMRPTPAILTVDQANRLLQAAQKHRRGRLAPYVAVCLFGGLRPFEAARIKRDQCNLTDGEICIRADQTKTRRARVVKILPTLAEWLKRYPGKPIFPANWRNDFDAVRLAAGFGNPERNKKLTPWVEDVMRHTAISHYFRKTGSYGLTAEWAGNSEKIIKDHYQAVGVSSEDTKKFYALLPKKGGRK